MILIILPTQLFPYFFLMKIIQKYNIKKITIIEETRYFTDYKFHRLKLAYHRATMKKYYDLLKRKKQSVLYIEYKNVDAYYNLNKNINHVLINPVDYKLERNIKGKLNRVDMIDNSNFLLKPKEIIKNKHLFYNKKTNKYSHDKFYKFQRKKLNILMNNGHPTGGKWSYDMMNRESLPNSIQTPCVPSIRKNKYINEAINYVKKNFKSNYGSLNYFIYPIDRTTSLRWFTSFLTKKLEHYGKYQDAVDRNNTFLFHSIISPMLNIGLITDTDIINLSTKFYNSNKNKININNYEGFIRQIIGWRNYAYSIYILDGEKMYNMNFLKHNRQLNDSWWKASTGITVIDNIIKNHIIKYAYCNHIERLMYLGNFLMMIMIDPKEVHRIFMEWTIDSYDWVMTPTIMGMSQYSDGGMMMTKPYFSSSNYIKKMSNYNVNKNTKWDKEWDTIYYNFIHKHHTILRKNYFTSMMVKHYDNKSKEEITDIINSAKQIIGKFIKK